MAFLILLIFGFPIIVTLVGTVLIILFTTVGALCKDETTKKT